MGKTAFTFLEQDLELYHEKALYWIEEKTLVVADVHFGKTDTFRAHGIPLPSGTTETDLTRLSRLIQETSAERLLILGDLLHARAGRSSTLIEQVTSWREEHHTLTIDLVLGNHDLHAGRPPDSWRMACHEDLHEAPFIWRHHPEPCSEGYVVAGHIHPGVSLRGPSEKMTLPCFYFGQSYGLLPAFGGFTGLGKIQPHRGDSVFVIVEDEVIPV